MVTKAICETWIVCISHMFHAVKKPTRSLNASRAHS